MFVVVNCGFLELSFLGLKTHSRKIKTFFSVTLQSVEFLAKNIKVLFLPFLDFGGDRVTPEILFRF